MASPRKQLADQLDRLDDQIERQNSVIDALADGLNQAVADAAKEGVKEAVREAVIELLTNADLRASLHQATATVPVEAKPTFGARLKAAAQTAATRGRKAVEAFFTTARAKTSAAKASSLPVVATAWRLRRYALVAVTTGAVVAGVSYGANHGIAAALSGVGAAATAAALQGVLWVRRLAAKLASI